MTREEDRERIAQIQSAVARIDERTAWLVDQARQQDDLTRRLAGRTVALETRADHADKSRGRMMKGIYFGAAVVLAYMIEHLLDLI